MTQKSWIRLRTWELFFKSSATLSSHNYKASTLDFHLIFAYIYQWKLIEKSLPITWRDNYPLKVYLGKQIYKKARLKLNNIYLDGSTGGDSIDSNSSIVSINVLKVGLEKV